MRERKRSGIEKGREKEDGNISYCPLSLSLSLCPSGLAALSTLDTDKVNILT